MITVTGDNEMPQIGCAGRELINVAVQVCNYCDEAKDWTLKVRYNPTVFEITDLGNFSGIEIIDAYNHNLYKTVDSYVPEQCRSFHFTAKVIGYPNAGSSIFNPIIDGEFYGQYALHVSFPEFVLINGTSTPAKISELIEVDPVTQQPIMDPTPCDGSPPKFSVYEISGQLNIDVESYCFYNYLFKMNPGAKIVVEPGKKLEITNGTKIFGCSELWESIEVQNGATLIIDKATMEDGYTAVHANGGGNLSITNSSFNRNFVGVQVDGPMPVGGLTNFNAFYGNTFDGGASILPVPANMPLNLSLPASNENAFAAVWIQTSANPVHSLNNVFQNLSNGIYANATSLKLTKNQFTNIWENGYFDWMAGYGVRVKDHSSSHNFQQTGFGKDAEPLSFSLCSKAMRLEGIRVDYIKGNNIRANTGIELIANYPKAVVINNRIESWVRGVELNQIHPAADVWVSLNDIEVADGIGIQSNMMNLAPVSENGLNISLNNVILKAPKTRGIELNANNATHIMENKVSANLGLSGFTGIRVNSDNSSALTCNEVTTPLPNYDNTFGIEIWDGYLTRQMCNGVSNTAKGVYFTMGSSAPERFQENTFEGNDIGLQLSTSAAIGQQTHRGNKWNGSFGSYGAQHQSSGQGDWLASQFIVNANVPGIFRPDLPEEQNPWFQYDPTGSPAEECQLISTCITEIPPFPADGLYGIDSTIASGGFQTTDYVGVTNWLSRRYLYGKLTENPGLIVPGSVFESFYNATANSTVGSFAAIDAGMEALYEVPAGTATQILAHFDTLSLRLEEAGSIDSLLQAGGYDTTLIQQRSVAMQVLQNAEASLDTLMQPVLGQRISDASTLASQNAVITADSVFELNERMIKDIYLNTLAQGITEFDGTQLASLESIAGQCPLTGGSAVFKARSLLAMVQDFIYDDEMLCEQIGERGNKGFDISNSHIFTLFPNPAKNEVTASFSSSSELNREIVLSDATGKEIWHKEVPKSNRSVVFETTGMQPGVYFCTLLENDVRRGIEKLIIIR